MERATFAAGCFWGVEETFRQTRGVTKTTVGYIGGHVTSPSYEQVCSGRSGHAEAVEVEFDPSIISFEQLVDIFFELHDPTTLNRQGPDVGEQYRSGIFYHDQNQKEIAQAVIARLEQAKKFPRKIVTEMVMAPEFFHAEDYHQQYFKKRGISHCHI